MRQGGFMKNWKWTLPLALALSSTAFAQEKVAWAEGGPNGADIAWMLISCALVMLMTPALAFFYGGLVRSKNALNTKMMSFIALALVSVLWAVVGYSLAFSKTPLIPGLLGNFDFAFLNGVGVDAPYDTSLNGTIPHQLFMVFQMMFAIITPALISGAIVDRMRFKTYLVFIAIWSLVVYAPLAHAVWSPDGFLFKMGALDFAGGTVVHISAGVSALVAAIILGPRRGFGRVAMAPHNVPFVLLGAGLLWFGWFGFNAGSAVASNGLAVSTFAATHLAAAAAMLVWSLLELFRHGKVTAVGAATGAVVGLVAITPASGFVSPMSSLAIGAIAAIASYSAIQVKNRLNLDDSLDVFACHGTGGIVGALLTGVFAQKSVNSLIAGGGLDGNWGQLWTQFLSVLFAAGLAGVLTAGILFILKAVMGLRPESRDEETGLDIADHGEGAYHGGEYGVTGGVSPIGSSVTLSVAPNSKTVAGD
jgi:ammonium transporter, Amt family